LSDSLFTTHRYEIPIAKYNEDYYLAVFSDVHRFAHNCDVDRWHEYLNYCKKLQKETGRVYFLGLGDYDDMASTSERDLFFRAKLHDTTVKTLDDVADNRVKEFIKELDFMKDRLLGLIEGNHYYQFDSGQTSTMKMCDALKCKYLGGVSIVRLAFKYGVNDCRKITSLDIYAHHTAGARSGGGRREGSSLNKIEDMAHVWDADIYLAGHDHKFNLGMPATMYLDQKMRVKQKERLLVRTGSYQKGYVPDTKGYVPSFSGKANFLGSPIIILRPTRDERGGEDTISIKKAVLTGNFF